MGNKFSTLAGGMSGAEMDAGYSVPSTFNVKNWDNMPAQVSRFANIQCENCHGPQGDPSAPGGFSTGHELTDVSSGNHQPFQSPRISYAAEVCAQCHAASTSHHDYSEWATLNPDDGRGHSNLAIAQSEGLSGSPLPDGGYQLNSSCGRCHTAQGFTEYVANLEAGNVGSLAPTQLGAGEINPSNVQPQTCAACHDPHQNQLDPVTGDEEHQLRLYGSIPLLPAGFGVSEMGAGAVCIACHNSRNGGYNPNASTNAESAAYLHEDSDPIGANPASASAALAQGTTKFSTLGGPHEANQGDVFEGHNAYFLNDQTPIISPHSAFVDTCVGCHMINNPNATIKNGAKTPEMHIFAIQNAASATLCNSCHGNGNSNVDGASLQASVVAGLANIITNMNTAVTERINDSAGAYKAPSGYGTWVDTGTITIAAKGLTDTTAGCTLATDVSCGLANSATVTIVAAPGSATGANALVSAVASPQGRSGMNVILTFANPVSISFKGASGTVSNTLTSFTVNMADLEDATGNRLFVETGNLYKANWNYTLIQQDKSNGVHNPPFVSAVLGATADPWGNPNATPPQPGGLWY
jgi:formate-dependent nitrite reductase cytochrome c552 subunit